MTTGIANVENAIANLQAAIAILERDAQALNPQIQEACTSGGVWVGF